MLTSSASRGISFPCAEVIIAEVPTFAIEAHLMELAQLIYRGRGQLRPNDQVIDGDRRPRRLVFLLADYVLVRGNETEARSARDWPWSVWNLLSALILLRATLLTRIKGDAGQGQSVAVVPVGRSAVADSLSSLFEVGGAALQALDKLGIDPDLSEDLRSRAHWLRSHCQRVLSAAQLELAPTPNPGQFDPIPPPQGLRTQFYQEMSNLRRLIGGPFAPLLPSPDPNRPWLSPDTSVIGPIVKLYRPAKARESLILDQVRLEETDLRKLRHGLTHRHR